MRGRRHLTNNSRLLPLFFRRFREQGGDARALALRHGLPEDAAELSRLAVSLPAMRAVTEAMAEALGDDLFGLRVATTAPRGAWGTLEYVGKTSATLAESIQALRRFSLAVRETVEVSFTPIRGELVVQQWVPHESRGVGPQVNECMLAFLLRYGREFTGANLVPNRVWFSHQRRRVPAELRTFFGTSQIAFGENGCGLVVAASALELPLVTFDPALRAILEPRAQEVAAAPTAYDWRSLVQEKVRVAMQQGKPTAGRVASMLHMSPRTLQRRLHDEGTSLRELVDSVRGMLARIYLSDPSRGQDLAGLAHHLGYTGMPSFIRAFRRWTGTSPGAFRQTHQARAAAK